MGVSTNGIICFGIQLEEGCELPWDNYDDDIEEWWFDYLGFRSSVKPFTDDGDYAPGVSRGDPMIDVWLNERKEFRDANPLPVEPVNYCSDECEMYILAAPASVVVARRGVPEPINDLKTCHLADQASALIEFCEKHGIEHDAPPSWYLCSYWG